MKVEDHRSQGAGWQLRLHEKGGKHHTVPCHHALAEALRAYIDAAGIAEDRKGCLFRTARGHTATALAEQPMGQTDAWRMIRRRALSVGIPAPIGNRSFRATGITSYLSNGGAREPAHHEVLRSHEETTDTGRSGEDQTLALRPDNGAKSMDVVDYIYVDRPRVDSYFQQVSPPVHYDKVPVWKAALGLTGPSAEGTQQRSGRPYTEHEKITKLVECLPQCKESHKRRPFQLLTCFAQRIVLEGVKESGLPGVALWACRKNRSAKPDGYLIESPQYDEDFPLRRYSGVTALSLLLQELDPITHELEIDAPFDLEKFLNAGLSKDAHRPEPEREVDCLVRLRIQSMWGYIGYPVFIAMHPSQFQDTKSRDSLIWDPMRDAER